LSVARELPGAKTVLLSNGSLFSDPEVRQQAQKADIVKVSLSAWDQTSFEALVRPHPRLQFDAICEGLTRFRDEFSGTLWAEVFVVPGINDQDEDIRKIAQHVNAIRPDNVHLNTAVRPPAESSVKGVATGRLNHLATFFQGPVEVLPARNHDVDTSDSVGTRPIL